MTRAPNGLRSLVEARAREHFGRAGTWSATGFAESLASWCGYSYAPPPLDKATRDQVERVASDVVRSMRSTGELVGETVEALSLAGSRDDAGPLYEGPDVRRHREEDAIARAIRHEDSQ